MSRNRDTDCCKYKEEKRRLALQKLRKKRKESKETSKNLIDDCYEDNDDEMPDKSKCDEKQRDRIEKLSKLISWKEELMGRIQPSIEEREKWSMRARHIRCFLEPAQIAKLELEEKILSILKTGRCPSDSKEKKSEGTRQPRKKRKEHENKKKDEEEAKDADDNREVNDQSDPEIDQRMENKPTKNKKRNKGEFWCPEIKKKVKPQPRNIQEDEIDCTNSICSFDSHIDLSGLALTDEDMKKIDEARRNRMTSQATESKNETK